MNGWNEFDHYLQSISVPNGIANASSTELIIHCGIENDIESPGKVRNSGIHILWKWSAVMILHNIDIINIDPSHFVAIKCRCICSWIVGSKSKHGYWIRPNLKAFNHLYCIIQPSKICCYCIRIQRFDFQRF